MNYHGKINFDWPQETKVRNRWLCLVRRLVGAGWSRRTSLPSSSMRERRSGLGGTRGSPPSAPSTSSSTASERAHIRAATAAPYRAEATPLAAAHAPPDHATRHSWHATRTRALTRRRAETHVPRTLAPYDRRAHSHIKQFTSYRNAGVAVAFQCFFAKTLV